MKEGIKEKIRPLWILLSKHWGGSEQVALSDIVEMTSSDIAMSLICLEGTPVHAAAMRHPGLKIYPIDSGPMRFLDWGFVRSLRETIHQSQANIIHLNDEHILHYAELATLKLPVVSIIANRHTARARGLLDFIRSIYLRRIDYIIALNESVKEGLLASFSIPEKKIKVINLGLDFSRFNPQKSKARELRAEWGADKDTIVIGSVGRLTEEVGQETFIKAAAGLLKSEERKMRFVMVSEEPLLEAEKYLSKLQALVSQFRMNDYITFCALGDNLPDIMAAFDIFVMPGREEVPGLGALEALAMERPVVLSNVVGAREIVGDKQFGLLVRTEDAFDLQSKILSLLENPSLRLEMGSKGRIHALKHFDRRIRFIRMLDVYEKCIKRRFSMRQRRRLL